MAADKDSGLMMPAEVARVFRISIKTLARWASSGKIRCIVLPSGHRRYRRADVEALLEGK